MFARRTLWALILAGLAAPPSAAWPPATFNCAPRLRLPYTASVLTSRLCVVRAALAVVGYAGHRNGWKVPNFSAFFGISRAADVEWCNEHNVPEAECIACHAELMPKDKLFGWCAEHGVHECVVCHPELAQTA